jgi:hypothetical protein
MHWSAAPRDDAEDTEAEKLVTQERHVLAASKSGRCACENEASSMAATCIPIALTLQSQL